MFHVAVVGDDSRATWLGDNITSRIKFEMITATVHHTTRVMTRRRQLTGGGLLKHKLQVAHI